MTLLPEYMQVCFFSKVPLFTEYVPSPNWYTKLPYTYSPSICTKFVLLHTYLYVVVNAGLHIDSWIFYQACACIPDLTIYVYLELYRQTQTFLWCRKFICFFLPTKIHSRFLHTKVSFFWVSSQDRSSSGFQPKKRASDWLTYLLNQLEVSFFVGK